MWLFRITCLLIVLFGTMASSIDYNSSAIPEFPGSTPVSDDIQNTNEENIYSSIVEGMDNKSIFPPVQDSYIDMETPISNTHYYAAFFFLRVRSLEGKNQRSLIQFNPMSGIPQGSQILDAYIRTWLNFPPVESRLFDMHRITEGWTDTSVTWNNQPRYTPLVTTTLDTGIEPIWLEWNVTDDIQRFFNGSVANHGWLIKDHSEDASSPGFNCTIRALEAPRYRPQLIIQWQKDTQSPLINLEDLEGNQTVYTPHVVVTGQVEDNVGVTTIRYYHDWEGGSWTDTQNLSYGYSRYCLEWPVTLFEGRNILRIECQDIQGNTNLVSVALIYHEDTVSPFIKIVQPREGSFYMWSREIISSNFPVSLIVGKITSKVDVEDNESGIDRVDFMFDGNICYSDDDSPYEWVMDNVNVSWGRHVLSVRGYDKGGNVAYDERDIIMLFI